MKKKRRLILTVRLKKRISKGSKKSNLGGIIVELKVFSAKSSDEAVNQLLESQNVDKDSIKITVKEKPSKGLFGIGAKNGIYLIEYRLLDEKNEEDFSLDIVSESKLSQDAVEEENNEIEDKDLNITIDDEVKVAREFIEELLKNANVNADVVVTVKDNLIKVHIIGEEASLLIGRRGETLDSIQFLTGLVLNKANKNSKMRVFIDIENYRSKREESLKRYSYKVAREVAKTKSTRKLDYMNPYERRIVHSALQNDRYVITYSEGSDPYRRVVIEYKK